MLAEKILTEKVGSCKIKLCGINPFNGVNKNLHYNPFIGVCM